MPDPFHTVGKRQRGTSMKNILFSELRNEAEFANQSILKSVLEAYGSEIIKLFAESGIGICVLEGAGTYRDASAVLRRLAIDVDGWPVPPAGLFVVEERTAYFRRSSAMTFAHELGHALDCALGDGVYFSTSDSRIQGAYLNAQQFVTPYAATRVDEYFAESVRAWLGINDDECPWPQATRERLRRCDPAMYEIVGDIFTSHGRQLC
jgi:hypothetical protein